MSGQSGNFRSDLDMIVCVEGNFRYVWVIFGSEVMFGCSEVMFGCSEVMFGCAEVSLCS